MSTLIRWHKSKLRTPVIVELGSPLHAVKSVWQSLDIHTCQGSEGCVLEESYSSVSRGREEGHRDSWRLYCFNTQGFGQHCIQLKTDLDRTQLTGFTNLKHHQLSAA